MRRYLRLAIAVLLSAWGCAASLADDAVPGSLLDLGEAQMQSHIADVQTPPELRAVGSGYLDNGPALAALGWDSDHGFAASAVGRTRGLEPAWTAVLMGSEEGLRSSCQYPQPFPLPTWYLPFHRSFAVGEFAFHFFLPDPEALGPDTMVYRRNPEAWAAQDYASLNPHFLPSFRFCQVRSDDGKRPSRIEIVDGNRTVLCAASVPDPPETAGPWLDIALRETEGGYWGAAGAGAQNESADVAFSDVLLYAIDAAAGKDARPQTWMLPHGNPWLPDQPQPPRCLETPTRFLFPALAQDPEMGVCVWRHRRITGTQSKAAERLDIWELLHWAPSAVRLLSLCAEYRGPGRQDQWWLDKDGALCDRPAIVVSHSYREAGMEPWPQVGLRPDGQQVMYIAAGRMVLARLGE